MSFWFLVIFALIISSCGFYKYVWFISLGYGFSIAGIGIALPIIFKDNLTIGTIIASILFIIYGCRLGGYLLIRELKSKSYNEKMKKEIKSGKSMKFVAKFSIWISCAILYVTQVSPIFFRLYNEKETDIFCIVGVIIMALGIILESMADLQKSKAKKINPNRFCDTGLYKIVRCPNYLGEVLFWTGVFISGINILISPIQWITALIGYLAIVYIMFGGARRLELRQNRTYGEDKEYQEYVKKTPILIPLIPLYSVAKYKWLVG